MSINRILECAKMTEIIPRQRTMHYKGELRNIFMNLILNKIIKWQM